MESDGGRERNKKSNSNDEAMKKKSNLMKVF